MLIFTSHLLCLCVRLAAAVSAAAAASAAVDCRQSSYWISVQKIFSRCAVVWSGKLKFAFKLLKGFTVYCFHSFVRTFVRPFVRLCSVRSSAGALLISIVREAAAEQQQQKQQHRRPKEETAGSSVWFYSTTKSVQQNAATTNSWWMQYWIWYLNKWKYKIESEIL